MPTLGVAIASIRTDLDRGTDFDARIQQAMIAGMDFYKARRFGFNTKRKTMTISSEFTSLTANFIEIDYAKLEVTGYLKNLREITYTDLNSKARDASYSSEPVFYAIENRNFRTYPAPDQTYSVQISMMFDVNGISLSTSDSLTTNAWLTDGYELIRHYALIELLEMYIDGPEALAKADRLRIRAQQIEQELKRRANLEQSSGNIKGCM